MSRPSIESLQGYLLEESLAYLVQRSGYTLLQHVAQDPDSLVMRGNGLRVRGRGGTHQADVLGDLDWTPAFTFPVRLFLEAKFRRQKSGIGTVRNAVGILADLNQTNHKVGPSALSRRYRYAYALCSTSGFSADAIAYALAHEISLLDMSGPEYATLRTKISESAAKLIEATDIVERSDEPEDELPALPPPQGAGLTIQEVRDGLRSALGILTPSDSEVDVPRSAARMAIDSLVDETRRIGSLFIGMGKGPFMLLISASEREAFLSRMRESPVLRVKMQWSRSDGGGREWTIVPADGEPLFRLRFSLPAAIGDWIFEEESEATSRASLFKRQMLPHIFVPYVDDLGANRVFRLDYAMSNTK